MKALILPIDEDSRPLYLQIAEAIRSGIARGRLRPGERLPSLRRLATELDVNRHTVMNALHELVAQGWLVAAERSGYFVPSTFPELDLEKRAQKRSRARAGASAFRLARELPETPAHDEHGFEVSFSSSTPDLGVFPFKEFRSHFTELDRPHAHRFLDYGDPRGDPALLETLEVYLRRLRGITDRSIVVTNGAQEGLFLVAQLLLRRGDAVAVERLGYPHAWQTFRDAGGELLPLELDEHGIDPESLKRLVRRRKVRLIYLTPLHQFPTTVTLSPDRRKHIYEIATEHRIPIIEDDYDHEFHYRRRPQAPMASDDPEGLVIYLSTFSKILFPAIRLGFLALDESLAESVSRYREIVNQRTSSLTQRALAHWMSEGGFERHLRRMTNAYRLRRDTMVSGLEALADSGSRIDFRVPDGGMAVWVDTRRPAARVAKRAAARGIYVADETLFSLARTGTHVRLGFARLEPAAISSGLELFREALASVE